MSKASPPIRNLEFWVQDQLTQRERLGLRRESRAIDVRPECNFASNDYLGLSRDLRIVTAAQRTGIPESCSGDQAHRGEAEKLRAGDHDEVILQGLGGACGPTPDKNRVGVSGSRLVSGTAAVHLDCEQQVARIVGKPAALVLGSGYHANLGCLQALLQRSDTVIADRFVHASMIDGISLSGARLLRFRHNDVGDLAVVLEKERQRMIAKRGVGRVFLLTESVFSINGDTAPLIEILDLAERFDAIVILDEAHAFGVYGKSGGGIAQELGVTERVPVITGSFGKAVGTYGGFVACSEATRAYLVGSSRAFIYSTGLPIPLMEASVAALALIETGEVDRDRLFSLARYFWTRLEENKLIERGASAQQGGEFSYIIPVFFRGNEAVCQAAAALEKEGIFVYPMRSPTVPRGRECLRFSITVNQTEASIDQVVSCLSTFVRDSITSIALKEPDVEFDLKLALER